MAISPAESDRMHRARTAPGYDQKGILSKRKHQVYTNPNDRRARATLFQFIRHDNVTFLSSTIAGVQFRNDCIAVST